LPTARTKMLLASRLNQSSKVGEQIENPATYTHAHYKDMILRCLFVTRNYSRFNRQFFSMSVS